MSADSEPRQPTGLELAVVGVSLRLPGAVSADEYWSNLRSGVESISFFSDEELLTDGVPASVLRNPAFVRAKGILEGIENFDAGFFGMSPRDAATTDPQQRYLLECAWEALEDGGCVPRDDRRSIGVFAGIGLNEYRSRLGTHPDLSATMSSLQLALATDKDYAATRIAYKLDLRGPAITVQTACSTGLVSVVLACQSLLAGACDVAIAAAASITVRQKGGYVYREGGIVSPDGHCRAFDDEARGCVGSSGAAAVVLKRLDDALRDGSPIRAVILGYALNNDGAAKVGFTAPGVEGQAAAIRAAHVMAAVSPESIQYVEAHGTGTPIGDPVEIGALTEAFRQGTARTGFCRIGSVKTNIGHTDTASGIAGLIKTVLSLQRREIPPSLNFRRPNRRIDFASTPFVVNTLLAPWPEPGPARAGVSSFGVGGTNAHVVLESAPVLPPSDRPGPHLFVLSARTDAALARGRMNLAGYLRTHADLAPAEVAATLQLGRRSFPVRSAFVAGTVEECVAALGEPPDGRAAVRSPRVVFLFPGQGVQRAGMARGLHDRVPVFREVFDTCVDYLSRRRGVELHGLLLDEPGATSEHELQQTRLAQPAVFVVEYALARTLIAWGCAPAAMAGHSVGELTCACLAGVFTVEDALDLVAARGELMQQMPAGAMLSVAAAWADVETLALEAGVELAAVNARDRIVVAGTRAAVDALARALDSRGIRTRPLATSHAFHCSLMAPAAAAFGDATRGRARRAPDIPYASSLTGLWMGENDSFDAEYWARHLREPVQFSRALETVAVEPDTVLVEIGPDRTCSTLARLHGAAAGKDPIAIPTMPHPARPASGYADLLEALGALWCSGVDIKWQSLHGDAARMVSLPTYPFERTRCWIDAAARVAPAPAVSDRAGASAAGAPPSDPAEMSVEALFEQQLDLMRQQIDHLAAASPIHFPRN